MSVSYTKRLANVSRINQQKINFMKSLNPLNSPKLDIHVLIIGTSIVIIVAIVNAILN